MVSKYYFHSQEPGCLEKWLIIGLEQEMDKMSLEYLAVSGRNAVLGKINR